MFFETLPALTTFSLLKKKGYYKTGESVLFCVQMSVTVMLGGHCTLVQW